MENHLGEVTRSSNLMCLADRRIPIVILPTMRGNLNRFGPADPGLNNNVLPRHSFFGWWV